MVRLTERALGLILACIVAVVLAGSLAVAAQFLSVSNAPLEAATHDRAAHVVTLG